MLTSLRPCATSRSLAGDCISSRGVIGSLFSYGVLLLLNSVSTPHSLYDQDHPYDGLGREISWLTTYSSISVGYQVTGLATSIGFGIVKDFDKVQKLRIPATIWLGGFPAAAQAMMPTRQECSACSPVVLAPVTDFLISVPLVW